MLAAAHMGTNPKLRKIVFFLRPVGGLTKSVSCAKVLNDKLANSSRIIVNGL